MRLQVLQLCSSSCIHDDFYRSLISPRIGQVQDSKIYQTDKRVVGSSILNNNSKVYTPSSVPFSFVEQVSGVLDHSRLLEVRKRGLKEYPIFHKSNVKFFTMEVILELLKFNLFDLKYRLNFIRRPIYTFPSYSFTDLKLYFVTSQI